MKALLLENKNFTDFNPVDFGYEKCAPSHSFGPHIRNTYLIHFVSKGNGIFKNEKNEYRVHASQAFVIRPGEVCYYEADRENPWEYTWIGFTGAIAQKLCAPQDVLNIDAMLIKEMHFAFEKANPEEYLAGMLFKIYAEVNANELGANYPVRVMEYINTNYMNSISVEKIADYLNLNRKYLVRIFKEKTGSTIQEYMVSKRLEEAKKLLKKGYCVSESAYMSGYGDAFNFSKAFKKRFGFSPNDYAKSFRK